MPVNAFEAKLMYSGGGSSVPEATEGSSPEDALIQDSGKGPENKLFCRLKYSTYDQRHMACKVSV